MGFIKEFLTTLILVLILIGFLYNHFSKDERDLPDSFFHNLYKLLASATGVPISNEPADDSNREWAKILQRQNFSKNYIKFIIIQTKQAHMAVYKAPSRSKKRKHSNREADSDFYVEDEPKKQSNIIFKWRAF